MPLSGIHFNPGFPIETSEMNEALVNVAAFQYDDSAERLRLISNPAKPNQTGQQRTANEREYKNLSNYSTPRLLSSSGVAAMFESSHYEKCPELDSL